MKTAYSYIRFSHSSQKKGGSKARQLKDTAAYCQLKGWRLNDEVFADEGVSGWKGKNADIGRLSEFLGKCKSGVIKSNSVLVIEALDRLARTCVDDAYQLVRQILKLGIDIATLPPDEEFYTASDLNNPGKISGMLYTFAANNKKSETLSNRMRENGEAKRLNHGPTGKWCPQWIRLSDELAELKRDNPKIRYFELATRLNGNPRYVFIKERADIVHQIVKWAIDGLGETDILKRLNSNPKKYPPFSSEATHWSKSYISKLLRSPTLMGKFVPGIERDGKYKTLDESWDDYYPRIISDADFYRLQAARKSRKVNAGRRGTEVANLFTGLLFNARDKLLFNRIVKDMPRLVSSAYRNGLDGHTLTIPYQSFETTVLEFMAKELKLSDLFSNEQTPQVDRVGVDGG